MSRLTMLKGSGVLVALLWAATPATADEGKPAAETPPDKAPAERKPQVRTYSSVTVVSDPSQAPRLPRTVIPRPQREERGEATREGVHSEQVRELREEIKEVRRGLREFERNGKGEQAAAGGAHLDAAQKAAAERDRDRRLEREHERVRDRGPERAR